MARIDFICVEVEKYKILINLSFPSEVAKTLVKEMQNAAVKCTTTLILFDFL